MSDASRFLRLFFAIPLPDDCVSAAVALQGRLAAAGSDVKWVAAENLHITLKFLGEMPAVSVEGLVGAAREVAARTSALSLLLRGVGAFPSPRQPRVVWIGCASGQGMLSALAADLEGTLVSGGLAEADRRPFSAHLTIGRLREARPGRPGLGRQVAGLAELIEGERGTELGVVECSGFVLYRSDLRPSGPVYTVVERFPLRQRRTPETGDTEGEAHG